MFVRSCDAQDMNFRENTAGNCHLSEIQMTVKLKGFIFNTP